MALFYRLVSSGSRFRLLGLDGLPASDATLIEVFPGAAWKVVADKPLPAKRTIEGRQARVELLSDLGVQLPPREQGSALPSHDQLDAGDGRMGRLQVLAGRGPCPRARAGDGRERQAPSGRASSFSLRLRKRNSMRAWCRSKPPRS